MPITPDRKTMSFCISGDEFIDLEIETDELERKEGITVIRGHRDRLTIDCQHIDEYYRVMEWLGIDDDDD